MKTRLRLPALGLLAPTVFLAACGGDSDPPTGPGGPPAPVASVSLSPPAPVIAMGGTLALTVTLRDAQNRPLQGRAVVWSSETPHVATVSNAGVVTAHTRGQSTITATSEGKSGKVIVEVTLPPPGEVASVELNLADATLEEGATLRLTATPRDQYGQEIPNLGIAWTSSDQGVAMVDALGGVTAFRVGPAQITAKVHGKQASAAITVTADHEYDLVFSAWDGVPGEANDLMLVDPRQPARVPTTLLPQGVKGANPAVSPDGRYVAFVRIDPWNHTDIHVADRVTGTLTQLTEGPAADDQPAWSADGSRLAFRRRQYVAVVPAQLLAGRIWTMNADGTGALDISGGQTGALAAPSWSPGAAAQARIVYSRLAGGESHLWTMASDGGDRRQVTSGEVYDDLPAWSPDGGTIAFTRYHNVMQADIWMTVPSGTSLRPFVSLLRSQTSASWSPDGKLIAFVSNHESEGFEVFTAWTTGHTRLARRTADPSQKSTPVWVKR